MLSEKDALIRAIVAAPEDNTGRLALADWLDENGDPDRALFIRIQIERASGEFTTGLSPQELLRKQAELLSAHREEWAAQDSHYLNSSKKNNHIRFERGFAVFSRINPMLPAKFKKITARIDALPKDERYEERLEALLLAFPSSKGVGSATATSSEVIQLFADAGLEPRTHTNAWANYLFQLLNRDLSSWELTPQQFMPMLTALLDQGMDVHRITPFTNEANWDYDKDIQRFDASAPKVTKTTTLMQALIPPPSNLFIGAHEALWHEGWQDVLRMLATRGARLGPQQEDWLRGVHAIAIYDIPVTLEAELSDLAIAAGPETRATGQAQNTRPASPPPPPL